MERHGRRQPEAPGKLGRRQPVRQLENCERVATSLDDNAVQNLLIEGRDETVQQQSPRVSASQWSQAQLRESSQLRGALSGAEDQRNLLGDESSGRKRKRLRGRAIEPLCVVDDDQERAFFGRFRQEAERGETDEEGVRGGAHAQAERDGQGLALRRRQAIHQAKDRGEESLQGTEGELDLPFRSGGPQDPEPRRRLDGSLEQRGLAQTRFAEDHQRAASSGPGALEQTIEGLRLAFATQQLQNPGPPPSQSSPLLAWRMPFGLPTSDSTDANGDEQATWSR